MNTSGHYKLRALPVAGVFFEDTIDGYFTFEESLRQLMLRRGFGAAWLTLSHAPFVDLPELGPDDPVPLMLSRDADSGLIRVMSLIIVYHPDSCSLARLQGVARWSWLGPASKPRHKLSKGMFSARYRLAEPAFVRGIGLWPGPYPSNRFGCVRVAGSGSDIQLISRTSESVDHPVQFVTSGHANVWGVLHNAIGIVEQTTGNVLTGESLSSEVLAETIPLGSECIRVRAADSVLKHTIDRFLRD